MLLGEPYDQSIDVWALGILLYEMIHGDAPYGEDTPMARKMEYIRKNLKIDYDEDNCSPEVIELIKKILRRDPKERLTLAEVFEHPWMKKYEANYKIDIDSFVSQNSRDASRKSFKTEGSGYSSLAGKSQKSIFSTMSSKPNRRRRRLRKEASNQSNQVGDERIRIGESCKKFKFFMPCLDSIWRCRAVRLSTLGYLSRISVLLSLFC